MGRNSLGGTGVVRERMAWGEVRGGLARWSRQPFSEPSRLGEHHGNGNEEESQNCWCFPGPGCSEYCQLGCAESTV